MAGPEGRGLHVSMIDTPARGTMRRRWLWGVVACVCLTAASGRAHHAFNLEFDASKPVTLSGVVARVEWVNPHALIYLDVTRRGGTTVRWAIQAGAPAVLAVRGWQKDSLVPGMRVVVDGFRAKSGTPLAHGRDITLPDGRQICANVPCRCCKFVY
jgi:hypothetical protein